MPAVPGPGKFLTPEMFGKFLFWLSPEPEQAAKKYLEIRAKLIRWFICNGCRHSEDLADEVLDRAVLIASREPDKYPSAIALCYGIARMVLYEYRRKKKEDEPLDEIDIPDRKIDLKGDMVSGEQKERCLATCLEQLPARERELFTEYHRCRGREKITIRKRMAIEHGGTNKLRIKAHRIGKRLNHCISGCVQGAPN